MSLADCKSRTPQEALENFEEAAKAFGLLEQFEGTIAYAVANTALKEAREELLIWMSYIP